MTNELGMFVFLWLLSLPVVTAVWFASVAVRVRVDARFGRRCARWPRWPGPAREPCPYRPPRRAPLYRRLRLCTWANTSLYLLHIAGSMLDQVRDKCVLSIYSIVIYFFIKIRKYKITYCFIKISCYKITPRMCDVITLISTLTKLIYNFHVMT